MPPKRPRSAGDATSAATAPAAATPLYHALSTRSGNVVAVGMQPGASLSCAGMAFLRVFQGHAELLGWQAPLATYCAVHSPKWSSLLVIEARSREQQLRDGAAKKAAVHDAESQGPFSDASLKLFAKTAPHAAQLVDMEEELEADRLARQIGESYAVVLVLRAIPLTFGNVMCYFEAPSKEKEDAVLPGFKIVVVKDVYQSLTAAGGADHTSSAVTHDAKSAVQVISELAVPDPSRTIQVSLGWSSTVEALERSLLASTLPQRIVVCGGKDVGKSTFCRYVVNRLLGFYDTVAFLDTDLGQPELTPPGMVSLHALTSPLLGPGFTHMKNSLRSFFCGGTNPGTDPMYYVKSVKSLLRLYERKWGAASEGQKIKHIVPLVINTDGWVKSMGHDLLCSVIQDADPHHVVQLLSTTRSKQFDVPTTGRWRVHSVAPWDPTMSIVQAPRSSKEMRLYRLHSYFLGAQSAAALPRPQLQNLHFITEKDRLSHAIALAYGAATPFAVPFDAVDVGFCGNAVPPSQLLASLNCSIVGLCVNPHRSPMAEVEGDAPSRPPRIQVQPTHAPCVGVGLVRGIDAQRRVLFLLSPLPHSVIKQVNLLVRASVSLDPLLLGSEHAVPSPYVVTDVIASEGTGSAAMQSRNNIKRKRDGNSNGK